MAVQILFRRGTATEWTNANPVLGSGEPGVETDTGRFKIGDGSTAWSSLPYATSTGGGATVLSDLTDVASTSPTSGQVLKWNGSQWAPAADLDTNTNTTYSVSAETATGGADVRLTGSDATTDFVRLTAGSNVTITRTDASTITIASTASGGASALDGLTDVVITSPTNGQVLKFDGSQWVNGTDLNDGTGGVALGDITNVVLTTPSAGQVLKFNGTSWINDTDATGGGALPSRAALQGSTTSLANNASGPINITGYRSYSLLKVQTTHAAWVRIYISEAARLADASRLQGVDPAPGSGVIAEVITTGAETVLISPGALGFNDESPTTTNIPLRVTNLSGGTATITVTLTAVQLEA